MNDQRGSDKERDRLLTQRTESLGTDSRGTDPLQRDPLRIARGIAWGIIIGSSMWVLVIALVVLWIKH